MTWSNFRATPPNGVAQFKSQSDPGLCFSKKFGALKKWPTTCFGNQRNTNRCLSWENRFMSGEYMHYVAILGAAFSLILASCAMPSESTLRDVERWKKSTRFQILANNAEYRLAGEVGRNDDSGNFRQFIGRSTNQHVVYGPYIDALATDGFIQFSAEVEASFSEPVLPRIGALSICVEESCSNSIGIDGSFVVDLTTSYGQKIHASKTVQVSGTMPRQVIQFEGFEFTGDMRAIEVRLHSVDTKQNGFADIKVFNTHINIGWNPR